LILPPSFGRERFRYVIGQPCGYCQDQLSARLKPVVDHITTIAPAARHAQQQAPQRQPIPVVEGFAIHLQAEQLAGTEINLVDDWHYFAPADSAGGFFGLGTRQPVGAGPSSFGFCFGFFIPIAQRSFSADTSNVLP
jgi:hypothetical protein